MRILVTGGSGYVGSHVAKLLDQTGHIVFVLDKVADRKTWVNPHIRHFTGDVADYNGLDNLFNTYKFDAVIHMAASSEIGPSVTDPLFYYANNVANTALLLNICAKHNVEKIVFSSTSAVYGEVDPKDLPTTEDHPKAPRTSYGSSKLCNEHMLRDVARAYGIRSVSLRYFNASGASLDASIGEFREKPTHLIPSIAAVAMGQVPEFTIHGIDYDTPDGTSIRDYTHVWDIAIAHAAALDYLEAGGQTEYINIGAGVGHSVQQMLDEFQKQWGSPIFFVDGPRRIGDIPINYADITKANKLLNWQPEFSTPEKIIEDAIRWYRSDLYKRLANV